MIFKKAIDIFEAGRRFQSDWGQMGHIKRKLDTRDTKQLVSFIENAAESLGPEIQSFVPQIKEMNPKYLGLVADTLELSKHQDKLPINVDLMAKLRNGKTYLTELLSKIVSSSKSNPNVLDFTHEIINNTDTIASKYFLKELSISNVFEQPQLAKHFEAAKTLVPTVAESVLQPPYVANNSLQQFVDMFKVFTLKDAKPEKVVLLKPLAEISDKVTSKVPIDVDRFVFSNTSQSKVVSNLNVLEQVIKNAEAQKKSINVVDFLLNNTNLR